MADKEQELLSTKQWDKLCKEYPLLDFSFQDGYAEEFRIILKAMGYVKWDREKVADFLKANQFNFSSHSIRIEVAGKLKEILAGGE